MFPLKARPQSPNRNEIDQGLDAGIAPDISPESDAVAGEGYGDAVPDIATFRRWFKADVEASEDWRNDAREDFGMVAGAQWSDEDIETLLSQGRPVVTFNRIGPFIDSIEGHEINNRTETRFLPRTLEDTGPNELLTEAARWVRDECDAEDEETAAVRDLAICGMGWTETALDYDDDPDGAIIIQRIDPLEMVWDNAARKDNLSDARRMWRVRPRVPRETAEQLYPEAGMDGVDATWARDFDVARVLNDEDDYKGGSESEAEDPDYVTQVEVQWWVYETAYRVADPATNKFIRVTQAEYDVMMKRASMARKAGLLTVMPKAIRDRRKCYYKAVLGGEVLSVVKGPDEGGFTWKCMTGKRDRNAGIWYGVVRGMKDPQRWSNKWLAQTMHIINSNAKGGVMVEKSAIENRNEFLEMWTDPAGVSIFADGALKDGRVQPKPQTTFPAGLDKLMEFAINSIPATAGINPEMLGQTTSMQPGVAAAEMGRKQQAMAILAGLFNAKRRYMKEQGRLLLWYIRTFISDGRLIRIGGAENARYVPMLKQQGTARYDVIVDDTPTSPNTKERTWGIVMPMMPMLMQAGVPPEVLLEILKFSPLPDSLTAKITKIVQDKMRQPQQGNDAAQAFAQAERAKAMKLQAETAAKMAEAQLAPARLDMEREMQAAKIEQARSAAIANLVKAGVDQQGAALDAAEMASRALLSAQDQGYRQELDTASAVHKAKLAERGQDAKERQPTR